jgi:S1 RNA binding domain protein
MDFTPGTILEGKVTGIMKFGAFVALPEGKSGLVHISEIANTYVNDVNDHLTEGQVVKVKIIGIDDAGRLNLSIKKALPQEAPVAADSAQPRREPVFTGVKKKPVSASDSFEEKLKAFMQDSESRISGLKNAGDKKGGVPRRMRTKQGY